MEGKLLVFEAKPLTPLMFRTPHPFAFGGYAESELWIPPQALVGAIRSAVWEVQGFRFDAKSLAGEKDFTGIIEEGGEYRHTYSFKWRLIGPYYMRENDGKIYYPSPLGLLRGDKCSESEEDLKLFIPVESVISKELKEIFKLKYGSFLVPLKPRCGVSLKSLTGYLISHELFEKILNTKISDGVIEVDVGKDDVLHISKVFITQTEPHIKLGRDKTIEISEEGKGGFYVTRPLHFKDEWKIVFGVWIEENSKYGNWFRNIDNVIVRLGGEYGRILIKIRDDLKLIEHKFLDMQNNTISGKILLFATSPSIFGDKNKDSPLPNGLENGVLAYCARRTPVGGWALTIPKVSGWVKELRWAVDRGSTYLIDLLKVGGNLSYGNLIFDRLHVFLEYCGAFGSCLVREV